jgi:CubicO group peptidase (beta-lactamase class C family)
VLGRIIEVVTGRTYEQATRELLFAPLGMTRSVFNAGEAIVHRVSVGHQITDEQPRVVRPWAFPRATTPVGGVVSTVRDLARFDAALDEGILLREDTLTLAWSNTPGRDRSSLPTGLGWFVQRYNDQLLVWHFGLVPNAYSSLVLKVPGRDLTLILLANSDGLSAPFQLSSGDVTRSPFALLFLRLFI